MAEHVQVYRERIAPLVRAADVFRLTGQPLRDGGGDRWCAFEYLAPAKDNGVVFIFRLPGGESTRLLKLRGLIAGREYRLVWHDAVKPDLVATGDRLMESGLIVEGLAEEESVLVDVYAI